MQDAEVGTCMLVKRKINFDIYCKFKMYIGFVFLK